MLTLFQLQEQMAAPTQLRKFFADYGFVVSGLGDSCPKCGAPLFGEIIMLRNKAHWRCMCKGCQKRVPVGSNSLLEGCKVAPEKVLFLFYFSAHDCGTQCMASMLGLARDTVAGRLDCTGGGGGIPRVLGRHLPPTPPKGRAANS